MPIPLRIVLLGTGEFALPPFQALMESQHDVVGVFTQPDRTGRGHHRHLNPVKELAGEHSVPVFQAPNVNQPDVLDDLRALRADAFIVAAFGQILKPEFLAIPPLGAFNLHGSLLPRHRGAAPVQYAIRKGDRETGVTIFRIEPALDSGPVVGEVRTQILPAETSGELMIRLAELSVPLTLEVVGELESGRVTFVPQDDSQVTLAPKIRKEDGIVDWNQTPEQINCHVRAMWPWPKAVTWLTVDGRKPLRCIILKAHPAADAPDLQTDVGPGTVTGVNKRLYASTGAGLLEIHRLQPDGKAPMSAEAFLNGYGALPGMRFQNPESDQGR